MVGVYEPGLAGGSPEAVLCTHLNLPVQGKVSIRHRRVAFLQISFSISVRGPGFGQVIRNRFRSDEYR